MTYCKFYLGQSDVHLIQTNQGRECLSCNLDRDPDLADFETMIMQTAMEAKDHLLKHRKRGDLVPDYAIDKLDYEISTVIFNKGKITIYQI